MKGNIKLHREIENHWLWEEPRRLRAWIYLTALSFKNALNFQYP